MARPLTFGIAWIIAAAVLAALLGGCSRLRPTPPAQYVYVTARQTFLRDRVAAVSNRTGTVENGQRLEVLERGRRFYKVRTANNEQGWIDDKAVATQQVFDAFQALTQTHRDDPPVASAVVRDEVNLHLKPGRETDRFYRLAEGDKVQLLERATLPKPATAGAAPARPAAAKPQGGASKTQAPAAARSSTASASPPAQNAAPPTVPMPVPMEDWWLARDAQGHTGWVLSRMIDVDAPDAIARYAEGQKIVGAYVLTTVNDPNAAQGSGAASDGSVPIYLTVMGPYTAGLAYDFDQVRVFTWNMKMHRYETAFRDKNIQGYLPIAIRTATDPYGKAAVAETPLPTFTYKVLAADSGPVVPDPVTGMVTPGRTIEKTYRLEGNLVRRVAPPGSKDEAEAHPATEEKKAAKAKKK